MILMRLYHHNDTSIVYLENDETGEEMMISYTEIAEAFERYGGSFVHSLGIALRHADPFNVAKILSTRPNYVQQYCNQFIIPQYHEEKQREPGEANQGAEEN